MKPGGKEKHEEHQRVFRNIWATYKVCARALKAKGGHLAIRCTGCGYHRWKEVKDFFEEMGMKAVKFHGCQLGLVSFTTGLPIMKPWTLTCTGDKLRKEFERKVCNKSVHPSHFPCAGSDTKLTENYTNEMCRLIHIKRRNLIQDNLRHHGLGSNSAGVVEPLAMEIIRVSTKDF
jgi:hypothetical protein